MGVLVVILLDLVVVRTRLLTHRVFWVAYAIIVFFQLVSNALLTGLRIVRYDGDQIIGSSTPADRAPPFLGDGRIAYAPVEDLIFGFALVLLSLILWVMWGRLNVQRTPVAGPPRLNVGRNRNREAAAQRHSRS